MRDPTIWVGFSGFEFVYNFYFIFFGSHWKCSKQKIEEEEERRCSAMSSPRSAFISFFFSLLFQQKLTISKGRDAQLESKRLKLKE